MGIIGIYSTMKRLCSSMTVIWILFFMGFSTTLFAQRPSILGVEHTTGSTGKTITINGAQFGTNPASISVRFGAAKGTIQLIQDHLLQVNVPTGATFDNISVTKTTVGLSAYSRENFTLAFNGTPGFDLADLESQVNFPSTSPVMDGLFDMCMCDFDGDSKNELAVTNENSPYIMVYPNTSTGPGNISFGTKFAFNTFARTLHVRCADINGDSKMDIIASDGGTGDRIFILRNTSTGPGNFNFTSQSISLTGAKTKQVEVADLDLDGKPEILISSQSSNTIRILHNQSSLVAVVFAPPITLTLAGLTNTDGLAVEDLNGDMTPEIVVAQYQTNSNVHIIRNQSTPGTINLELTGTNIPVGGIIKSIKIADVDGNGTNDVSFTQQGGTAQVGIASNQSSPTAFTFAAPKFFATDGIPYGMDFGDLNGDGRADVVVASATKKSLTILINESTPGSVDFSTQNRTGLTYLSRHVRIGDLDSDGKPDIAFTSIDDAALVIAASKVSVIRNKTCVVPEITPAGPLNICNTFPQELKATYGPGLTYAWKNNTTGTTTAGTETFTPSVSGNYTVVATGESGTCVEESNIVNVTISAGTAADPLPVYNDPVCVGGTISFSLNNNLGAGYTYNWTGPDNYTATGATPSRANARLADGGEYHLDVIAPGGCVARKQSIIVKVIDKPDFTITFPNSEILCSGQFKKLTVNPISPDYTYQWFETTAGDLGVSGSSHDIATGGEYFVRATSTTGCGVLESSKAAIKVLAVPAPAFTVQSSACKGQEITYTDQSTVDSSEPAFYYWVFGDGNTSTTRNTAHIYNTIGTKSVTLTVSYKNNACARTSAPPAQITITDAPTIAITSSSGIFTICPDGELTLNLAGTFNSYEWSTGATTSSIDISQPGTYSVEVVATNGCELKAIRDVDQFPAPIVQITASPAKVDEGEASQLFADGLLNYSWTPTETLNNSNIQGPTATPLSTTTYTVVGFDTNGCQGTATIEVKVQGDAIVDKLFPSNFLSPNTDAKNPHWLVGEITEFPQCGVTIYDDKGVKVFEAKPYLNNWDGTNNGKPLADGVYYYIIRCDGEESKPRMGSITLLR